MAPRLPTSWRHLAREGGAIRCSHCGIPTPKVFDIMSLPGDPWHLATTQCLTCGQQILYRVEGALLGGEMGLPFHLAENSLWTLLWPRNVARPCPAEVQRRGSRC